MIDNIITIQKLMRSAKLFNVDNCFSVSLLQYHHDTFLRNITAIQLL